MSNIFKKPSGLITITHKLTAVEHKIYNFLLKIAIDELSQNKGEESSHNGVFETTFTDIKSTMGLTENRQVKKALASLRANGIKIDNMVLKKGVEAWNLDTSFLGEWKYKKDENVISYQIPHSILELLDKKYIFAPLDLKTISSLKNKHSIWLYEVITDYKNIKTGIKTYTVDEIRYLAGLSDTYKVGDIKLKILSKSIEEINKKTNLNVSLLVNKRGVKIVSYTFKFYDKDKDIGKLRYIFRMWLYEYMLDIEITSKSLELEYYLSKNKNGKVLVYDCATNKPIRKELSFKVFDMLFENREAFFQKKFKNHYPTKYDSIEEELENFKQNKEFYLSHKEQEKLDNLF